MCDKVRMREMPLDDDVAIYTQSYFWRDDPLRYLRTSMHCTITWLGDALLHVHCAVNENIQ